MLTMPKQGWLKRQTNNFQRSMNVMLAGALMLGSTVGLMPQTAFAANGGDVWITAAMPNPSGDETDGEYVILQNKTSGNVDVGGWTLDTDGQSDNFATPTNIAAGGSLKVCSGTSPAAPADCDVLGFTMGLSNTTGNTLTLREGTTKIDEVVYDASQVNEGEEITFSNHLSTNAAPTITLDYTAGQTIVSDQDGNIVLGADVTDDSALTTTTGLSEVTFTVDYGSNGSTNKWQHPASIYGSLIDKSGDTFSLKKFGVNMQNSVHNLAYGDSFTFVVTAKDKAGNESTKSVELVYGDSPDTDSPTVEIKNPADADGAEIIGELTVEAKINGDISELQDGSPVYAALYDEEDENGDGTNNSDAYFILERNGESRTWTKTIDTASTSDSFDLNNGEYRLQVDVRNNDGVSGNYNSDILDFTINNPAAPAPVPTEPYKNGFETNINGWSGYVGGSIARVDSTNGVDPSAGGYFAVLNGEAFSRWGGYANQFPLNGYTTEVDVYLDMSKADSNDNYIDFSSAINGQDGKHQRDFIFHVGHDPANSRWSATVSNNSSHSQSDTPHLSGSNLASITETGWYTLQSYFHSNDSGEFAVDMKIIDMNENVVGSWTLSSPSDVIATEIGGNRYGWFAEQPFTDLPIDNSCLYLGDPVANGCGFVTEEPDNKDPVVTFLAPKDGGAVDNLKASVKIEDKTNVTQYSFRVDGPGDLYWTTYKTRPDKKSVTVTDYNLCENAHGFDCELSELPDGKYRVSVLAYDGQGNDSRENKGVEFFLDTTGPKAEFTKPSNDSLLPATVKLQLELAAQGKAGLGQQHIELKSDNFKVWWKYNVETGDKRSNVGFGTVNYSGDERSGTLTVTFDRSKLENGTYHGRSFAQDQVGNRSVAYYSEVVADNTDPGIDFVTPNRFDNATYDRYFQSLSEIKIKGTDEHGVKSTVVHIYNANGSISTAWCGAAIPGDTGSCDTSSLANGDYYVKVAATDNAGNSNYATKHFTIDSTPPEQVKGLAFYDDSGLVADGITSDYSVTAKWDAVNTAAKYEYCYWNDIAASTYREANCYNTFPTNNQQSGNLNQGEGTHYVKVRAVDAAGNKGEWSETVALVYDKTAPTLGLTAPAKTVSGDWVDVKGYVFDRNFNHYYCYLTKDGVSGEVTSATDEVGHGCVTTWASDVRGNAGNWHTDYPTGTVQSKTDTTGSKLGELDIRGLSDGNYTVHLVGIDRAGNQAAATTSFTIDNDNSNTDDNGELVGTPKPAVPNKDGEFTPGALYFMWVACYNYSPAFPNCDRENAMKPLAGEINYGTWKDDTYDLRVFNANPAEEANLTAVLTLDNTEQVSYDPKADKQTLAGPGDYWWQVRACDELSSNCSEWSTPTRFTLLEVGGLGGNTGQFSPASRQTGLNAGAPLGIFAASGDLNSLAGDAASSQADNENEQQDQTDKKDGGSEVTALNTSSGGDSDKEAVAGAKDSNVSTWWWLLLLVPAVGYYVFRRSQSEEPAN